MFLSTKMRYMSIIYSTFPIIVKLRKPRLNVVSFRRSFYSLLDFTHPSRRSKPYAQHELNQLTTKHVS